MFTVIKWIKGNPYKYQNKTVWDTKKKTPKTVFVAYLRAATEEDVRRYYKGTKYDQEKEQK
jgi:hypothetical protein